MNVNIGSENLFLYYWEGGRYEGRANTKKNWAQQNKKANKLCHQMAENKSCSVLSRKKNKYLAEKKMPSFLPSNILWSVPNMIIIIFIDLLLIFMLPHFRI